MDSLIVLGASVRALAFSAVRAGFKPYAVDLFADRDLTAACEVVKIARYPYEFAIALAAAPRAKWMYTGGLENYPRLIERLAKIRPLVGNSAEAVRAARNPTQFGEAVRETGLLFPELGAGPGEGRWLLKARRSSGGLGVRFATAGQMHRLPRGSYLQRYVEGEAISAVFVGSGGKAALIGLTKQLVGRDFGLAREFLYVGNVGPLALGESEADRVRGLGNALAGRFGLVGLFNVDLVRDAEGLWPVEINPRYSASVEVLERGLGVRAVKLHVAACESEVLPTLHVEHCQGFFGKAVVYAQRDGRISAELEDMANELKGRGDWPEIADLPRTGEQFSAGQPVVTMFAEGATMQQVEGELRRRVDGIQRLLCK